MTDHVPADWYERVLADNERLRHRLNEVDAQLTAEGRIHARENMALRAEKDAEIERLRAEHESYVEWTQANLEPKAWCEQLSADNERLQDAGRDLLHAIGHDRKDLIDEAAEKMRRAMEHWRTGHDRHPGR